MKIVYLVPGLMPQDEASRRVGLMRQWAAPGTQIDIMVVKEGPASIESTYEELMAVPATARMAIEAEDAGYDAAIIGCAGDPGMDAIRELTTKMLVVGPGAASFHAACMLGHRFGVLETDDGMLQSCVEMAFRAGVRDKLAAVESIDVPVLDMMAGLDVEGHRKKIVEVCRGMMRKDRVDVIVMGCMSMAFMDISEQIEAEIGIPVVNPAKTAVKFTEALLACGLMHSKAAFPLPVKVKTGKVASVLELMDNMRGGK